MSGNTSKSKSSYNSSTTNQVNPYGPAQPLINQGLSDTGKAYDAGYGQGVFGGERVPGSLSGQTQAGQSGLSGLASKWNGMSPVSAQNMSGIAAGNGNNPYFNQQLNNALSNVGSQVNNTTSAMGMGSSAQAQQLGTTLGQTATDALANQYNQNIQQELGANDLIDRQQLGYGGLQQGMNQANINAGLLNTGLQQAQDAANMQKFNEGQMAPWKGIGLLTDAINGLAGGYGTSTSNSSGNAKASGQYGGSLLNGLAGAGAGMLGKVGSSLAGKLLSIL